MSWGYSKEDGPATWAKNFPAAGGPRQSPVDIVPASAVFDQGLANKPLTINYSAEDDLQLENPGLSFKANISRDDVISGGPLDSTKYKLVQFHFHWGKGDKEGSEHTVNGAMYPSELHLVHYNADKYASFGEAVTESDGLAVLGVFIKVGSKDHAGFKTLSDNVEKVKCKGNKCGTGSGFNPASLLPGNTTNYWTYEGSLTTPPCCESVRWIVFQDVIEISAQQIDSLRNLCCDECGKERIPANYRPPLPLGKRELRASFRL
ncbi:carbonic anhydrase 1 [Aplysia californica]|uniref:Carbonic anhydrase n=1 Tax=Aplysia californica TaxID=6500 RepID=A0ABM1A6E5_APLCA|nr:carbonic anhydrase 1 [Aplysia californica]